MTALVLHLSDVHIHDCSDFILGRAEQIAATLFPRLPAASAVFIVVSGDIAQAGRESEYRAALVFFLSIKEVIRQEKELPVEFVIAPGNHDCDFSLDQAVRNAVLKEIPQHAHKMPESLISEATKVQAAYKSFWRALVSPDSLIHQDELWSVQSFTVEGKNIWFDSLNLSWMSSRHEQQGGLLFPFQPYREFQPADCDLRIAVMHHPLNWFQQGNYQEFRTFIQKLEDLIISGHEHEGNASVRVEANSGECALIEGSALQDRYSAISEFNIVSIDVGRQQFSCERFAFTGARYVGDEGDQWFPMRALPKRSGGEFQLTSAFGRTLSDPGATLRHPDKQNLVLEDFYVFPDLDLPGSRRDRNLRLAALAGKKSARTLKLLDSLERNVLLEGEDSVGKTRLLYRLFTSYHEQGYLPLLIDGRKLKSATDSELRKLLRHAVVEQYGADNLERFDQAKAERKILLVDDFDSCGLNEDGKRKALDYFQTGFHWRVVTVGGNFEAVELVTSSKLVLLEAFVHYRILPLGYERRGELVSKWNALGHTEVTTPNQWLQSCYQAERMIEAAKLHHLATPVPILVLSLLQANSSAVPKDLQGSSFAHYFYFLIVGALTSAGVTSTNLNRYLAFCSHLAWFVKSTGTDFGVSESQFQRFCQEYTEKWTRTDPAEAIAVLTQARILDQSGDLLRFAYPYTYYYFLGRYTSQFIGEAEVGSYLEYCLSNLYVRECANALLFLAHHSSSPEVVDRAIAALDGHFPSVAPASLGKGDIKNIANLISGAPALVYEARDPVEHRELLNRTLDEIDDGHDGLADAPSPQSRRTLIEEIVSLSKTIEVSGALLTSHFASFSREKKNQALRSIFNASLRVISDFFHYIERDPERLVQEISARVKSRKRDLLSTEAEMEARHAVAWVIRLLSASWIMKAALHVNTADLTDNVTDVVESGSLAFKLIRIAQLLDGPGRIPKAAINELLKSEADNPCVMSVLLVLVLNRLYMYQTHHEDKHWAITTFDLAGEQVNGAERRRLADERRKSLQAHH